MWIQEGAILDLLFTWVGGGRQNDSATAPDPDLMGLLGIELGLCTPSRFRSVCRSHRLSGCLCLLLLTPPQSQRILFSTTQMFSVVCCAALSCVYNKEVLVWRWRKAVRWGSECRWGGGSLHCWCKHWMMPALPRASNKSILHRFSLFSSEHIILYFPEGQMPVNISSLALKDCIYLKGKIWFPSYLQCTDSWSVSITVSNWCSIFIPWYIRLTFTIILLRTSWICWYKQRQFLQMELVL